MTRWMRWQFGRNGKWSVWHQPEEGGEATLCGWINLPDWAWKWGLEYSDSPAGVRCKGCLAEQEKLNGPVATRSIQ